MEKYVQPKQCWMVQSAALAPVNKIQLQFLLTSLPSFPSLASTEGSRDCVCELGCCRCQPESWKRRPSYKVLITKSNIHKQLIKIKLTTISISLMLIICPFCIFLSIFIGQHLACSSKIPHKKPARQLFNARYMIIRLPVNNCAVYRHVWVMYGGAGNGNSLWRFKSCSPVDQKGS